MNTEFVINADNGTASFPRLEKEYGIKNIVTYDNSIWGNMNPYFADTDEDKERITQNDDKVRKLLGADWSWGMGTPSEKTYQSLDDRDLVYWKAMQKDNPNIEDYYIRGMANAVYCKLDDVELVAAPCDAPMMVIVNKDWDGYVFAHVGTPLILRGFMEDVILQIKQWTGSDNLEGTEAFTYPRVHVENYPLRQEKFDKVYDAYPNLRNYLDTDTLRFDYWSLITEVMVKEGIKVIDSGIDTYTSAKEGGLFSYMHHKGDKENVKRGAFNVAVCRH